MRTSNHRTERRGCPPAQFGRSKSPVTARHKRKEAPRDAPFDPGSNYNRQAAGITLPVKTTGPVGPFGFGDPPTGSTDTANIGYAFTEAALNRAVPPTGSTPSETGCPSLGRPQSCMDLSDGSDEPLKRRTVTSEVRSSHVTSILAFDLSSASVAT